MDRQLKIILIVAGSVIVATGIGFGIYFLIKKNSEDKTGTQDELNPYVSGGSNTGGLEAPSGTGNSGYVPLISPTFNSEGELTNSMVQLKGRTLYPKTKAEGGADYANVRSSAEVNTDQGWWDTGNKITTIYKGTGIGKVISETTSVLGGYPYRWFKVNLNSAVGGHTIGYVRADTVTIKPAF